MGTAVTDGAEGRGGSRPWSRRSALAAGGAGAVALVLAACSGGGGGDPTPRGSDDPDFELRARVFDAEQALMAAYAATADRHPSLRGRLTAIRSQHLAHAAAVSVDGDLSVGTRPAPTPAAVPSDPEAALTSLARLERAAAAARVSDCTAVSRPELARVLSLIGGSEASHAVVLGGTS